MLPIFRSNPDFDIGIPVFLLIFCFVWVKPIARFQENDSPGIKLLSIFITFVYSLILEFGIDGISTGSLVEEGRTFLNSSSFHFFNAASAICI